MYKIHWKDLASGTTGCSEKPMTLEMATVWVTHMNEKHHMKIDHWVEKVEQRSEAALLSHSVP